MRQIVLNIPESKYNFFLKVIENFKFVKVSDDKGSSVSIKQKQFVDDTKQSMMEMELHQQGKIELKTLDNLIDEL